MKHRHVIWFITVLIFTTSCAIKSGNQPPLTKGSKVSGKVIAIIDGDTYDLLIQDNRTIRVRMEGIDAPEKGMPYSKKAKKYLSDLCFGEQLTLKITGIDRYERIVAFAYLNDGTELSHEMIKAGFAWHLKKYNTDKDLSKLEVEARNQKKGLWLDSNPMPPWLNRSYHRQGISTKDSFNIKENER